MTFKYFKLYKNVRSCLAFMSPDSARRRCYTIFNHGYHTSHLRDLLQDGWRESKRYGPDNEIADVQRLKLPNSMGFLR